MRFRRKHNSCLNCGYPLEKIYNFCPNCGQENTDANIPFPKLIGEFLSNYFAIDSKFGLTFKPFFIKPGFLTNEFMDGKRNSYAHPIRIYLVISLIFFAIFSISISHIIKNSEDEEKEEGTQELVQVENLPDSVRKKLSLALDVDDLNKFNQNLDSGSLEDLSFLVQNLSYIDKKQLAKALTEEDVALISLENDDSSGVATLKEVFKDMQVSELPQNRPDSVSFLADNYFNMIDSLSDLEDYSEEKVVELMKLKNPTSFNVYTTKQFIRVYRAGNEAMISYIIKNISIMMLILIPIFALLLKLLYIRRNIYYLKHLIHALHIHSFAYLVYGICLIITTFLLTGIIGDILAWGSFLLVTIYSYLSFLRVYRQSKRKTFVKFILIGTFYSFVANFFFLGEVFISLLLF